MKKIKRYLAFILSLPLILGAIHVDDIRAEESSVALTGTDTVVSATVYKVTDFERITSATIGGPYSMFKVNGKTAFCGEFPKKYPLKDEILSCVYESTNDTLRKVLYYGYDGPRSIIKNYATDVEGQRILTSLAVSLAHYGVEESNIYEKYHSFYNALSGYSSPPSNFKVYVAVTEDKGYQDLVFYEYGTGWLTLVKSSANSELTEGNNCYSLEGAQYTVYSDKNKTSVAGIITTDANGKSVVKNADGTTSAALMLRAGLYYIQETKAPKGYLLDETLYEIMVSAGGTTTFEVADVPEDEPISVLLSKVDKETNNNKPENSLNLEGAEFTVKYFAGNYKEDVNPEDSGVSPTRTWVLKTDGDGFINFNEDYKVSGDDFYYNSLGTVTMPFGTITIQETKAPFGYQLNKNVFVRKIDGATADRATSYNIPTISETPIKVTVVKEQKGTNIRIPDTEFVHVKPDGTEETVLTDENGEIHLYALAAGVHSIYEKKPAEGYIANESVVYFKVTPGVAEYKADFINTDSVDAGQLGLSKDEDGNGVATFYNDICTYTVSINKLNSEGTLLSGAEFTIYEDENLTVEAGKSVTENGILSFEDLSAYKNYYIVETKAPPGYKLPEHNQVYKIYVESIPVNGVFDFYINDAKYTVDNTDTNADVYLSGTSANREITMKIVNTIHVQLPHTGSYLMLPIILIGASLMVVVLVFEKKMKKENE